MFDFAKARKAMVESQIQTCGVTDPAVLDAFGAVEREAFVPANLKTIAYCDESVSLARGHFLLAPMVHARMLQVAEPQPHEIALDVGCASGYSSAILSRLVSTVIALEEDKNFAAAVEKQCEHTGACNVVSVEGPLAKGYEQHGPYDLIMVNGASAEIPYVLAEQLSAEGRLLFVHQPVRGKSGSIKIVTRAAGGASGVGKQAFSSYTLFDASAPYLKGFEPQARFAFS
ncbi:MAG TPA: protein-L-isoaspartate O-methyltransferase [Alphaproteobacteria bacterium]|nr:protein-L-isoaspartate O-methyltransferase [Alphaproteobacteria bacterium]